MDANFIRHDVSVKRFSETSFVGLKMSQGRIWNMGFRLRKLAEGRYEFQGTSVEFGRFMYENSIDANRPNTFGGPTD